MASYGLHLGIAFQLVDDALDYMSDDGTIGKQIGDDLDEGKPTLPVIRAMEVGTEAQRKRLRQAIEEGGRQHIDDVIEAIVETKAIDYTVELARWHAECCQAGLERRSGVAQSSTLWRQQRISRLLGLLDTRIRADSKSYRAKAGSTSRKKAGDCNGSRVALNRSSGITRRLIQHIGV